MQGQVESKLLGLENVRRRLSEDVAGVSAQGNWIVNPVRSFLCLHRKTASRYGGSCGRCNSLDRVGRDDGRVVAVGPRALDVALDEAADNVLDKVVRAVGVADDARDADLVLSVLGEREVGHRVCVCEQVATRERR